MEDANQLQAIGIHPVERLQLLRGIHSKPYRALCLIGNGYYLVDQFASACQHAARFKRRVGLHVSAHLVQLLAAKDEASHRTKIAATQSAPRMMPGSMKALRMGTSWLIA